MISDSDDDAVPSDSDKEQRLRFCCGRKVK